MFALYMMAALGANAICWVLARRVLNTHAIQLRINARYLVAGLLACALLQAYCAREVHGSWQIAVFIMLTAVIAVSAFTDATTGYVFDVLTLPALGIALTTGAASDQLLQVVAGAGAGALSILLLYALSAGTGVGLGDVKLAACAGALLGIDRGLVALGIAFVAGGSYAAYLMITRRASRKDSMPFAPFLAAGILATLMTRGA